jgi:hypothetical protein
MSILFLSSEMNIGPTNAFPSIQIAGVPVRELNSMTFSYIRCGFAPPSPGTIQESIKIVFQGLGESTEPKQGGLSSSGVEQNTLPDPWPHVLVTSFT